MYRDPIVEEVRKIREARAAKFGFDVRAMMEDARKREAKSGHRIVNLQEQNKPRKAGGNPSEGKTAARRDEEA